MEKDKLKEIFDKQFELQVFLDEISNLLVEDIDFKINQERIDKTVLCIVDELFEFLRETNYKYWRIEKSVSIKHLQDEWIDIFKFVLNLGIHINMTPDKILKGFNNKTKRNYMRKDGTIKI